MEKYSDIVQFSRDLYLNFLPVFMRPPDLRKLNSPKYIRTSVRALHYFASCFYPKIQKVFDRNADQPIDSDEQLLKYAVPRCLKLIDQDEFHFSFMLVAAFVGLLQYHRDRHGCFRFMLSGYKCLAAVYYRGFEDKFEHHGGWRGLRKYCEGVVRRVKSIRHPRRKVVFQELVGGGKEDRDRMSEFISRCDSIGDFELNDREHALLSRDDIDGTLSDWYNGNVEVDDETPVKVKWTLRKATYTVEVTTVLDVELGVMEISVKRNICENGSNKVSKSSEAKMQYPLKNLLEAPIEPGIELKELVSPEPCEGDLAERNVGVKFLPCLVKRSVSVEGGVASSAEDAKKDPCRTRIVKYQAGDIKISEPGPKRCASNHSKCKSGKVSSKKGDRSSIQYITESRQGEEHHFYQYNPTFSHIFHFFTDDIAEIDDFEGYDRRASSRQCKSCGYRCYQYAKYLYKKHRDLSLRPVLLRRTKARILRAVSSSIKAIID